MRCPECDLVDEHKLQCSRREDGQLKAPAHSHDWRYHPQLVFKSNPEKYQLVCAGCGEERFEIYDARGRWHEPVPVDADVSSLPRWE